jgi:acetyl esterase/lipase
VDRRVEAIPRPRDPRRLAGYPNRIVTISRVYIRRLVALDPPPRIAATAQTAVALAPQEIALLAATARELARSLTPPPPSSRTNAAETGCSTARTRSGRSSAPRAAWTRRPPRPAPPSRLYASLPPAQRTSSTRRVLRDLAHGGQRRRYGRGRNQLAELRLPVGSPPHPVVVTIHGGYWRARYSRRVSRPIAADLARRGWASWNVEYRRVGLGQGGGWPATFEDVAAGIDALADVEPGLLDLDRVAAVGHSAGGHLALWAATRPGLPDGAPGAHPRVRLSAVAALAAVSDLEASRELTQPGGRVYELVGGAPGERDGRYELANPIRRLPLGIPVLLVHGEADQTVPVRRSRDFAAAAREAGDEVELVEVGGADHRAVVDPRTNAWAPTLRWLTHLAWAGDRLRQA